MNSKLRMDRVRKWAANLFSVAALFLAAGTTLAQADQVQNPVAPAKADCWTDVVDAVKAKRLPMVAISSTSTMPAANESGPWQAEPPLVRVARGDEVSFALYVPDKTGDPTGASVDTRNLLECLAQGMKDGKLPRLVLNGMPLGAGARLVNTQDWSRGTITFELRAGLPSELSEPELAVVENFWTSVYRKAGWWGTAKLRAELQLDGIGTIARSATDDVLLSGSSKTRRTVAIFTALAIIALFFWALFSNEIFRDQAPAWIEKARTLAGLRKSASAWQLWLTEQATLLGITVDALEQQARQAYERIYSDPAVPSDLDAQLAATGALLDGGAVPQVSYSLSRVQMGAWLILTIVGGLAIWIFHGQLPAIPLTYLALLGISGGTRLLSGIIDNAKEHAIGGIHQGFFADLMAGTNGGGVHRYQALMINVMLLATVTFEIFRNLAFPEIVDSWLILLSGSAGIYMATKQIGENPPPAKPGPTTPAGGPPGPPADGYVG